MQIHNPNEIIDVGAVNIMLYGLPGSRKTTFAMTATAPLLIDADNGIRRVSAKYRTHNVRPKTWVEMLSILDMDLSAFQTIITDTVGSSLDLLAEHLKRTNSKLKRTDGALTIQGFGVLANTFRAGYLAPLEQSRKDLVFIAHHKEEKGQNEESFLRPDITGQTLGNLIRRMDLVGLVHIRMGRPCVTFTPTESYFAKNSAGLPDFIFLDEQRLSDIADQFRSAVNSDSEEYAAYVEQMGAITTQIANATNAEEINNVLAFCSDLTKRKAWVYSARTEAVHAVRLKAEELGLEIGPDQKYISTAPAELAECPDESAPAQEPADPDATIADHYETAQAETMPAKAQKKPVSRPLSEVMAEAKEKEGKADSSLKNTPKI